MDSGLRLLPIGAIGELCVGGDGVGRGYLNRPELTAQKFVQNPYKPEERLYRSGDLAKLLLDGDMEYYGRMDHQVKIRGHRIELGEIEATILKHDAVREAIVLANEDENKNKYICLYYVEENEVEVSDLKNHLSATLPNYMIPSYFVKLDKVPLNSNNKLDRKALPSPQGQSLMDESYEPPTNEIV